MMRPARTLSAISVAAMLISVHYGTGFVVGTGEKALSHGAAGSLYPVSAALGILAILLLARFYWMEVDPLWTLLGTKYGRRVRSLVGMMSWAWMIGVVAAQVLGGAFTLKLLGIPALIGMVTVAGLVMLVSLLPVERAGVLFQGLLLVSSLALFYALWRLHGVQSYFDAILGFVPAVSNLDVKQLVGTPLNTILLTAIGMDFHQFVVRARDVKTAYWGCLLASATLLLLAFLPSSVVIAARDNEVLPSSIGGKEAIAFVLSWVGGGYETAIGILLILSLLVACLGSGGGVLRIMNRTLVDFGAFPASDRNRFLVAVLNALLVLGVAVTGRSIIDLIVSFYAIYVAGVLVPFAAYLVERSGYRAFSARAIRLSLLLGGASAAVVLVLTQIARIGRLAGDGELAILLVGLGFSVAGLLLGRES